MSQIKRAACFGYDVGALRGLGCHTRSVIDKCASCSCDNTGWPLPSTLVKDSLSMLHRQSYPVTWNLEHVYCGLTIDRHLHVPLATIT
jgi:hypothetical protein